MLGEKKYKLKNGEPVDVLTVNENTIKVFYNGVCFERPASLLGKTIFCVDDNEQEITPKKKKIVSDITKTDTALRNTAKTRRKVIEAGDTVCVKIFELNKKAVYTISLDNTYVTADSLLVNEGIISNESPLAQLLLGERANSIITATENGETYVIQVLSFFKKTIGIYQKLKEQVEAQKLLNEQRKEEERLALIARKKMRSVKTGNTVCIEFLDTNEKQAFKIVEAWVKTSPDNAMKPYRQPHTTARRRLKQIRTRIPSVRHHRLQERFWAGVGVI